MKIKEKSVKAVMSLQVNKKRTFHVHMLMDNFSIVFHKYILRPGFMLGRILLFLIFHQISDSCSYKIIQLKKVAMILLFDSYEKLLFCFPFSAVPIFIHTNQQ